MSYKIEKGIATPQIAALLEEKRKHEVLKKTFQQMQYGDSILLSVHDYIIFCRMLRKNRLSKSRHIDAKKEKDMIRTWRISRNLGITLK